MANNDTDLFPTWRSEFLRLDGAYAPSTMRSYFSDVEAFETWCLSKNRDPFPASVDTVCRFLEDQGKEKAPSTVRRRLYGIRKVHQLLRLEDPTFDVDVDLSLRRVRRLRHVRPNQAKGMTREHLDAFLAVQQDFPIGWRNQAMLSLGYDLLTRRSELVALLNENVEWMPDGTLRVLIRRSKSDQFGQGRVAFTSKRSSKLLAKWVDYKGSDIPHLFCPVYQNQAVDRELSSCSIKRIIKEAAEKAGYSKAEVLKFSGHSMRVGAAQDLLKNGNDTAAIMRAGGWKSINILARYLELAEHNVWE